MTDMYMKGFEDAIDWASKHFSAKTGMFDKDYPEAFYSNGSEYNCGFGEGLISGKSMCIEKAFGTSWKMITWKNGKPFITL